LLTPGLSSRSPFLKCDNMTPGGIQFGKTS
jgi:hypothetical protein